MSSIEELLSRPDRRRHGEPLPPLGAVDQDWMPVPQPPSCPRIGEIVEWGEEWAVEHPRHGLYILRCGEHRIGFATSWTWLTRLCRWKQRRTDQWHERTYDEQRGPLPTGLEALDDEDFEDLVEQLGGWDAVIAGAESL